MVSIIRWETGVNIDILGKITKRLQAPFQAKNAIAVLVCGCTFTYFIVEKTTVSRNDKSSQSEYQRSDISRGADFAAGYPSEFLLIMFDYEMEWYNNQISNCHISLLMLTKLERARDELLFDNPGKWSWQLICKPFDILRYLPL